MRTLAIVHQDDAGPGVFAQELASKGVALDRWRVPEQENPPADPRSYDAVMTFGGAMHVDQADRHAWIAREKALLRELIDRGTPVLGACLGAQLFCEAAGGEVRRMTEPEIGWIEVEITGEGADDALVGPLAPSFTGFEWHSYECVPPSGSVVVARSAACAQAFRLGERAWGIQFHAEVSAEDANHWIDDWRSDEDAVRIGLDPEALRARTSARIGAWNELGRTLCGRFLEAAAR